MKKNVVADISLLMVAFVWGTTFVVVQNAISILPPHSFNAVRFALASITLLIIILLKDKKSLLKISTKELSAGITLGFFLFGGYAFQTVGLLYTTASKAGFITGLSVVLVPLLSVLFLRIIPKWPTVLGVILAAFGLYLLTMIGEKTFQFGDILVFFCAVFFALQIVFTGKFAPNYRVLVLAFFQVSVVSILSFAFAILNEDFFQIISFSKLTESKVITALVITSVFATALAFWAQTAFQRYTTPTRVAIIFAMEPVFAALTSFIVLGEILKRSAMIGGLLIFLGMILAEIPAETIHSIFQISSKKSLKRL